MSEHDPYCQWPRLPCQCADFAAARAEARADEREQVIQDITKLVLIVDHAESVAARLVTAICEQEAEYLSSEAWWEESKRQLDDVITAQLLELRELRRQT